MQVSIPDLEEPESKKDRKIILRKEKLKNKRKEKKKRTCRSKKDKRRRIIKKSNSKDWFGKNIYTGRDYCGSVVG